MGISRYIDLDAEISNDIKIIYCDTRDFCIGWDFNSPKAFKKAEYGYEVKTNKGLRELYKVFKKQDNRYIINKCDILKWLDELCKETGGYVCKWRYLIADIDCCREWDIKYIRFIRDRNNPDNFIVCNSYMFPISYKEIIGKIDMEHLCAY